jgi:preprotein translocase subunit SecA
MLDSINKLLGKFLGNKSDRDIKDVMPLVEKTKEHAAQLEGLSNDQLREKSEALKARIKEYIAEEISQIDALKKQADEAKLEEKEAFYNQIDALEERVDEKIEEILLDILPEAFAVVKDTARRFTENSEIDVTASELDKLLSAERDFIELKGSSAVYKNSWQAAGNNVTWDMIHYDVQLIGGIVLHQGKIAEMATGEGKTLVATLPVFLNALAGRGVHLVTVNDYLARRDSEWMRPIFEFHGLRVDCIDKHQPNSEERRKAYEADITYGTNNEFGFDYLRDNMSSRPEDLVQKKHHYAIVDEVDSVLIDDARTPLIISGPTPKGDEHEFMDLKPWVEKLVNAQRKYVTSALADAKKLLNSADADTPDKKELSRKLKEGGLAVLRAYRGLPKNKALIKFLSEPGIRSHLTKTENFYLQDQGKEMPFVDQELFFVIEEKQNSVELTEKGLELITGEGGDPNFFVLPDLATEIDRIENSSISDQEKIQQKDVLIGDYTVKTERIHTVNQLLKAYAMFERDVEYVVMDNSVKIVDEQTGRIMEGRRYSDGLHQAIEAKENVNIEAATQTYATVTLQNYFRMYHKLSGMTGTAETEAGEFWEIYKLDVVVIPTNRPIARDDRDDLVFKTAREKYNNVIDEIENLVKAGRPVLVGTTSVEISELLSRMLKRKNIDHQVLNAKLHQKEADIVLNAGQAGTVTIATNMAGRGTDIKLGAGVKEAGGLAIIGTERHDSRRVDRQLRGRAGRQGDSGSSQFYVSLEDNLMRIFMSDRVAKIMDRLGLKEGEVIQHSMITKSIERAQKKVEENNFGVRKRLLEYDDVMNQQREVIYKKRRHALHGERLEVDIVNSIYDLTNDIVFTNHSNRSAEGFRLDALKYLGIEYRIGEDEFTKGNPAEMVEEVFAKAIDHYRAKSAQIAQQALPVLQRVLLNEGHKYENIVVPFTDGKNGIQVVCPMKPAVDSEGKILVKSLEKGATLAMIDTAWKEHLRQMDDLRQSVQTAAYEQKDPLLIYKFESFELFKRMVEDTNKKIISFLMHANLPQQEATQVSEAPTPRRNDQSKLQTGRGGGEGPVAGQQDYHDPSANRQRERPQPVKVDRKIGRNERVRIQNVQTNEIKETKFKQAEPLIESGSWVMVEQGA